jgi:RNA polymerase sigma-70 factor (ECF subfamily)
MFSAFSSEGRNDWHLLTRAFAPAPAPPAVGAPDRSRDRALLTRVAAGDVAALRALYDEHAPRAMAIALQVLRSSQDAEDVVQETFLELWRRAAQFDDSRGTAIAWVVTIARSRAIDRLRASSVAGRVLGSVATGDLMGTALPSPADRTEERREGARVAAALAALPALQRETIELAYFQGLSHSEIAVKTGSPLGTVKMRVKLAMQKLSGLLREGEE